MRIIIDMPDDLYKRIIKSFIEGKIAQSEKNNELILRLTKLFAIARHVFEDEKTAVEWMTSPQFGLGGNTPIEFMKSKSGAQKVENLLGRIEYGVYS